MRVPPDVNFTSTSKRKKCKTEKTDEPCVSCNPEYALLHFCYSLCNSSMCWSQCNSRARTWVRVVHWIAWVSAAAVTFLTLQIHTCSEKHVSRFANLTNFTTFVKISMGGFGQRLSKGLSTRVRFRVRIAVRFLVRFAWKLDRDPILHLSPITTVCKHISRKIYVKFNC